MPFYVSPDEAEDVVPFDDLNLIMGRALIDGKTTRFVGLKSHGHFVGFDLSELTQVVASLAEAKRELFDLCRQDERKASPEADDAQPQTTQFKPDKVTLN